MFKSVGVVEAAGSSPVTQTKSEMEFAPSRFLLSRFLSLSSYRFEKLYEESAPQYKNECRLVSKRHLLHQLIL